ncbi:ETRAMP family protein [Winogradskyella aurantiaca]|uniref:hypothetical protein n=1 Tax=Winogradskyella aurantiaca TaxID=2219558 RepID=UPI001E576282|nr:hypothetical protein [Winogradskyella aurantiaca]
MSEDKPTYRSIYLLRKFNFLLAVLLVFTVTSWAQVSSKVDTTQIAIGEQIKYEIKVETDTTNLVVFPEGQTFLPLELVESTAIDSIRKADKIELLRTYLLTQFDSGSYVIPRQKVLIQEQPFFTDSLLVSVVGVEVDTTKQGLYDIKPIIEADKSSGNFWKILLMVLLGLGVAGFLLYWFIWRKKPLTEEEEVALMPPYEQAKYALTKLEESRYLIQSEVKEFYSELTLILRKYLDEKVYDRAMESTTDQLITRLELLKEGNQIPLKKDTIKNIETILKRADLVKFAKSEPDIALAEMDKTTIEKEIDEVKLVLPEPSEEEKLLNEQYRLEQEQRKKRKKIIITVAASVFLLVATFIGFGITYGFTYVKDTIVGKESKELLEGQWVSSAYGFPPIFVETPQVLKRDPQPAPEGMEGKVKTTIFNYNSLLAGFFIEVGTITYIVDEEEMKQYKDEEFKAQKILESSEGVIQKFEANGAQDILVKRDQFITPNAAEGLKTFGTFNTKVGNETVPVEYAIFIFMSNNVTQVIAISWHEGDPYLEAVSQRIIDSLELIPDEVEEEN